MDGIILINKEKDWTSRDVVNVISSHLQTKKVGHFGTLDPLATGLLVIGVGKYTKFQKALDNENKEYEVEVYIGKSTTTYDITGEVLQEQEISSKLYPIIKKKLLTFKKKYLQEVPIYSAVKVKGEKLYNYARNNIKVELPKKEVEIFNIDNICFKNKHLYFTCLVSKGCYIRSIINDLSKVLDIPMCLSNLKRTKIDKFNLSDSYSIEDIKNNKYKFYDIKKVFKYKQIELTKELEKKILNGAVIKNIFYENKIIFTKNKCLIALYGINSNDNSQLKKIFFF